MTITSQTFRFLYTATAAASTLFPYTNKILDEGDLKVYEAGVLKTITTHYTVTGVGLDVGGNVEFLVAPSDGTTVLIAKDGVELTQDTDYVENDAFPAASHENALDKLTNIAQRIWDHVGRSIKLPITSELTDLEIPEPSAAKGLKWNATEDGLENSTYDIDTQQAGAETAQVAAELAETNAETAETGAVVAQVAAETAKASAVIAQLAAEAAAAKFGTKGGDLASANPLVIGTDGNYFDVTGTTNFASMTVAADRFFGLQFDGILTMTHHATTLDLPGGANITTAAGDVAYFQSTGANTVQCVLYTKADGTPIAYNLAVPGDIGEDTPGSVRGTNTEIYKTATGDSPLSAVDAAGTIVSNYGMTDADCIIDLPTAAEGLAFVCILPAVRARYFRLRCPSAQADKIYLDGVAGNDDGYIGVASGYATGAAVSIFTFKASDGGFDWFAIPLFGTWVAG